MDESSSCAHPTPPSIDDVLLENFLGDFIVESMPKSYHGTSVVHDLCNIDEEGKEFYLYVPIILHNQHFDHL